MTLKIPKRVPEPGFYYHYKHDMRNHEVGEYAYEVMSVGFHTEDDARPGEEWFVNYRPLYESSVYLASLQLGVPCVDTRPLGMWMGEVEKDGKTIPRFQKIMNAEVLAQLRKIKAEMYPE